jgi:hypothetical protein
VVLIVQHTQQGTVGLLLNRPTGMVMRPGRGGLRYAIIGAPEGMQEVFADNRCALGRQYIIPLRLQLVTHLQYFDSPFPPAWFVRSDALSLPTTHACFTLCLLYGLLALPYFCSAIPRQLSCTGPCMVPSPLSPFAYAAARQPS